MDIDALHSLEKLPLLEISVWGNSLLRWLLALAVGSALFVVMRILKRSVGIRLERRGAGRNRGVNGLFSGLLSSTSAFLLFALAFWSSSQILILPAKADRVIFSFLVVVLILQGALWASKTAAFLIKSYAGGGEREGGAEFSAWNLLSSLAQGGVWLVAALLLLDNFGIDITALIAGLGVGGIAVALAVQNVLGDVMASLSIVLDKPFAVGDFIIVGEYLGTVESIGIKTTRLRSLSGEQLILSNSDLLSSRIRNYKRMFERRVVFSFGVIYETPAEKLKEIPTLVRRIIESQDSTRFDRAHFHKYGNSALEFEVVYYVLDSDYNLYMDIHQAVNLALFEEFAKRQISFAYPTQTLYVTNCDQREEV